MLTIFYDGNCPLCSMEMKELRRYDQHNNIQLEDIHQRDFEQKFPDIDKRKATNILHGKLNGVTLLGLDVTCHAWRLVGKKPWIAVLRFPIIKPFADWAYLLFAKHRTRISSLLMGKKSCENGQCSIKATDSAQEKNNDRR
jgi:predicted DCC family thiol-disulfide oxidoreductase YuxK